ncbi:MAG: VWA domain-containing protein [Flavobacteriaceae bacterium]|nr:VWA domain-containing protein [Flavobacteriaceae bacterium]
MYGYQTKFSNKYKWIYGTLRFVTIFSILVLLINPKFTSESYTIQKPNLPVLIDNSASVKELNQSEKVLNFVASLKSNEALNDKFDLSFYSFGSDFRENDSLSFSEKNTNISKALSATNELFKNETAPTILITDGNQTLGNDYEFSSSTFKNAIYPVILGDSTKHIDLKIEQLNSNRYAFLKNKFPVEAILVYSGTETVSSQFEVKQGNTILYKENVSFTKKDNTKILSFTLPASSVGFHKYTAQIIPLEIEKNKTNNNKQFAVEVIDQATKVLIVSEITHPDLGMLKKSIESNEQRKVEIKKPSEALSLLNDFQLIILYQPSRKFSSLYSEIKKLKKNTFTFTGLKTDWNFLNTMQFNFRKEVTNQTEDVIGILNANYGSFAINDIDFSNYRPLKTLFGELELLVPNEFILEQSIDGYTTESALFATTEINGKRDAIFDGEGVWRWRAQSYLENNSFEEFDNFIGKTIQYLASNKRRSRLEVSNETFYYNNKSIKISAQYFDKNFIFDSRASLLISVTNTDTKDKKKFPLLLKSNFYEVDLNNLEAGNYSYKVSVNDEAVSRSGNFTILNFNVEQQFLNADVTKLSRVATNTKGKAYFISEQEKLISNLIKDDTFQKIQKSEQKIVALIDWQYLLGLIVLTLALEWFIRKYNGLL